MVRNLRLLSKTTKHFLQIKLKMMGQLHRYWKTGIRYDATKSHISHLSCPYRYDLKKTLLTILQCEKLTRNINMNQLTWRKESFSVCLERAKKISLCIERHLTMVVNGVTLVGCYFTISSFSTCTLNHDNHDKIIRKLTNKPTTWGVGDRFWKIQCQIKSFLIREICRQGWDRCSHSYSEYEPRINSKWCSKM